MAIIQGACWWAGKVFPGEAVCFEGWLPGWRGGAPGAGLLVVVLNILIPPVSLGGV